MAKTWSCRMDWSLAADALKTVAAFSEMINGATPELRESEHFFLEVGGYETF